jgi:hypothetical protein
MVIFLSALRQGRSKTPGPLPLRLGSMLLSADGSGDMASWPSHGLGLLRNDPTGTSDSLLPLSLLATEHIFDLLHGDGPLIPDGLRQNIISTTVRKPG